MHAAIRIAACAALAASCALIAPGASDLRLVENALDTIEYNFMDEIGDRELGEACVAGMSRAGAAAVLEADFGGDLAPRPRIAAAMERLAAQNANRAALTDACLRAMVARLGNGAALVVLTGEPLKPEPVTWRRAPGDVAYVRIPRFEVDTLARFAAAMHEFTQDGSGQLDGVILDLRGNTGGLLLESVALAAAFLPASATIVEMHGRAPGSSFKFSSDRGQLLRGAETPDPLRGVRPVLQSIPLAVWVDRLSGAGAEIAAAALQDHRRATVVGAPTEGRNAVTTLFPLTPTMVLQIPSSRWERPSGGPAAVIPRFAIEAPAGGVPDDALLETIAFGMMAQPPGRAPRRRGEPTQKGRAQ